MAQHPLEPIGLIDRRHQATAAYRSSLVTTSGLDRLDTPIDGHPGPAQAITAAATITIDYPAGTNMIELAGFESADNLQRRRLDVRP